MSSSRRKAREIALQGVYSWLVGSGDAGAIEAHLWEHHHKSNPDKKHFDSVFYGVVQSRDELDTSLAAFIDREVSELSPIEHGLLLIGLFELHHHIETPFAVIINEAVELGKSFGGTDGYKYVNGVLDRAARAIRSAEVRDAMRG